MSKLKQALLNIEKMPEGEEKELARSIFKSIEEVGVLQAEFNLFGEKERQQLPEFLREFFGDKVA